MQIPWRKSGELADRFVTLVSDNGNIHATPQSRGSKRYDTRRKRSNLLSINHQVSFSPACLGEPQDSQGPDMAQTEDPSELTTARLGERVVALRQQHNFTLNQQ